MAALEIESDVTGTVWKIEMEVGASVSEGDVIMILESMKMEIPVEAPASGTIAAIRVQPEEQVDEGQIVAVLEA